MAFTSAPLSAAMRTTRPATSRLDLVEQLHRLDQPDHLADRDLAADPNIRRRARGGRRVEEARERGIDGETAGLAPQRGRQARRRRGTAGRAACLGRDRDGGRGGKRRERRGPAEEQRRAAGFDLELREIAVLQDSRQPVDRGRGASPRRTARRSRRRPGRRAGPAAAPSRTLSRAAVGSASSPSARSRGRPLAVCRAVRVVTRPTAGMSSAVFCPPNPKEFDSPIRRSCRCAVFGREVEAGGRVVRSSEVDRRRYAAVAQRQDRDGCLDRAGSTQRVTEHALVCRDRDVAGVIAEDRAGSRRAPSGRLPASMSRGHSRGRHPRPKCRPSSIARRAARTAPIPPGGGSVMWYASAVAP